ncbi:MAG: hypothetical protein ACK5AO_09215 [bacterium]|jgi:hypothetical protein
MISNNETAQSYSPGVRITAKVVSVIFHPLVVGVIMAAYLLFFHPSYFIGFSDKVKLLKLLAVINNNVFFPLLVVALLKGLGFNKSILLNTQKERIVPYIASITFFFWTYYIFRNQPETPRALVYMCRGMFFAASAALVLNNYYKISMHAIGVGGLLGLAVVTVFDGTLFSGLPVLLALIISGLVITARRIASDHQWFDLISGFIIGLLCQLLALWF